MQKILVIRDGKRRQIEQFELVLDDLMVLSPGSQIKADSIIVSGKSLLLGI